MRQTMRQAMATSAAERSERPALAVEVASNPHLQPLSHRARGVRKAPLLPQRGRGWGGGEVARSLLVEGFEADQLAHMASRNRRVIAEVDAAQLAYEVGGAHED